MSLVLLLVALAMAQDRPTFRVKVDMVVLSFTITDNKGHYINGLKPKDFRILEDGIPQKFNTFADGDKPPMNVAADGTLMPMQVSEAGKVEGRPDAFVGTNVFLLYDTSNYMYRGFVYASDAIADFIRGLDRADSVAVYTYSRNLSRAAPLTKERNNAIFGLRNAVAGDDSALYNCLLLTLRDAARVPGRKVVIVFSNGPDNASMVAPDDVRAVAEDEGIPIYVISTNEVTKDPVSSGVFKRISTGTGGKSYFAKTWQKQVEAFEAIREDLGNSYTITYYPQPNPNEGFRKITVEVASDAGKKYRVQARPGYRPHGGF
ncbi:MAG TPA: VWA domain-containing protein [Bryobacteraceae bacterium]|nr:VWA domain-containing protein [Bryobacteraceae bacterium]